MATAALSGVLVVASPASASPADCSLSTKIINNDSYGLYGLAEVDCPRAEHTLEAFLRRKDFGSGTIVASDSVTWNPRQGYASAYAIEPCSDVQTNKSYYTTARLFDERFAYPILVKANVGRTCLLW